ncbi:hypothetical protein MMC29_001851 [Sticta canariensis]|nr:hypothetical protein [Sticta canariensis]
MKASIFAFKQGLGPFCKPLRFSPSRQVSLLCRPTFPPNSHLRHHFYPGPSPHRNGYSTIHPDEGPRESLHGSSHENPHESPDNSPDDSPDESPDDSPDESPDDSSDESPDELTPSFSPPPRPSNRLRLVKVSNIPAPHLGHIRVLTLNSWKEKNALSLGLLKELRLEIKSVKSQKNTHDELGLGPTRVLIVASELNVFCAGANFKVTEEGKENKSRELLNARSFVLNSLCNLKIPSISAVGGLTDCDGVELALATDLRVFSAGVSICRPESLSGIHRLRGIIGEPLALEMMVLDKRMDSMEAYSRGLCQRVVYAPKGEKAKIAVLDESLKVAVEICKGGPLAINAALKAVRTATPKAEREQYNVVLQTKDRNRALAAFLTKEKPVFQGN